VQRRSLGRSGLDVGWLGLDPSSLARQHDDVTLAIGELLDAGGNLIQISGTDVAGVEPSLRDLLRDPGLRRDVCLNVRSAQTTRGDLLRHLDDILDHVGIDSLDLWTLTGWAESWDELATAASVAVASGRAHYVCLALPSAWQNVAVAGAVRCKPPGADAAALAATYSLMERCAESDFLPAAHALGAGFIAGAPLAYGVLTGKYRHGTPPDSRGATETHGAEIRHLLDGSRRHVMDGVAAAADGLSTSPANVALAWVRDAPGVSAVVPSVRTIHQWRGLLGSDGVLLPREIRSALDDVSAM
jgi:aryl-alcohol dehydrogenase-like predicted oxidoreductase